MLFYKVLKVLGVLEHALILGGSKISLFFHIIYIITIPFSPAWHKRNIARPREY